MIEDCKQTTISYKYTKTFRKRTLL
uniref:Uncharacterized protein n=1 Tax=Arundo donax TaxID=35708 RepID=A0A0A9EZF6_ARUDO